MAALHAGGLTLGKPRTGFGGSADVDGHRSIIAHAPSLAKRQASNQQGGHEHSFVSDQNAINLQIVSIASLKSVVCAISRFWIAHMSHLLSRTLPLAKAGPQLHI